MVGSRLKRVIKIPMVLLCLTTSLCGGTSLVLVKCCLAIVSSVQLTRHAIFAIVLGSAGLAAAGLQCFALNLGMKYYRNLDVMPTYQSLGLISWLLSGLILINEIEFYTFKDLMKLLASTIFVILGVIVISIKRSEIEKSSDSHIV